MKVVSLVVLLDTTPNMTSHSWRHCACLLTRDRNLVHLKSIVMLPFFCHWTYKYLLLIMWNSIRVKTSQWRALNVCNTKTVFLCLLVFCVIQWFRDVCGRFMSNLITYKFAINISYVCLYANWGMTIWSISLVEFKLLSNNEPWTTPRAVQTSCF